MEPATPTLAVAVGKLIRLGAPPKTATRMATASALCEVLEFLEESQDSSAREVARELRRREAYWAGASSLTPGTISELQELRKALETGNAKDAKRAREAAYKRVQQEHELATTSDAITRELKDLRWSWERRRS